MNQYITAGVIITLAFLLSIFIVGMYIKGVKNGMQIAKGREPEQIKSPVDAILDYRDKKQVKQVQDKELEGWQNIFNYDGNPQGGDD